MQHAYDNSTLNHDINHDINPNNTPIAEAAMQNENPNNTPIAEAAMPKPVAPPSLSSSAMQVEVVIRQWGGRKLDKRASEEVQKDNDAERGVVNVRKKLLGNSDELQAIAKMASAIRQSVYNMTMPWSDAGPRLLPTTQYFGFHQEITAMQGEFDKLVENFLRGYAYEVAAAQTKLGDLFVADDYPSTDELRGKFSIHIGYMPLPDVGDFRLDIGSEALSEITQHYESHYSRQLETAMNNVWIRLHTVLARMSERLDWSEADVTYVTKTTASGNERKTAVGRKTFRDTLVTNVLDMVDLMRACNLTHDTQMSAVADDLEDALRGVTPDALRLNEGLRKRVRTEVDTLIDSLPSLDI